MKVIFFTTARDRAPVIEFISNLPKNEQAKIAACMESIQSMGLDSLRVQFRQIKGKLWEIKLKGVDGSYRIFYVALNLNMILLHAYKKQSQKAPQKEIEIAEKRMREVLKNETYYT